MSGKAASKPMDPSNAPSGRRRGAADTKRTSVPGKNSVAGKAARKSERAQPYHHGDLHEALLKAAKRVAEREGLSGLTLRAVAREAGVSHAAPAHHFGDITGLLSELAALGFARFSAALSAAETGEDTVEDIARGKADAYVNFARENPCMFSLMFRAERLDYNRPALQDAATRAFQNLANVVAARRGETISPDHLTLEQAADIARVWSMVHGFAMLHLDGRLKHIMDALPPGTREETLLAAMLRSK